MSKNITIKEGAVARNFTGVKKLQTNLMGGGNQSWVPEDEAADYCTFKKITFRDNGTYKAEDNACDGFSEVTVATQTDTKEKIITENGEYLASDDNCVGFSKVTVNVAGGGAGGNRHTVIFFAEDRTTILERVQVEDGGGAVYHGQTPTSNAMRFVGWSPNPQNVRADMNCYPRFENMDWSQNQINDGWITIAQNVRQNPDYYPIGAWKMLELNEWERSDGVIVPATSIKMQLVAKGVDKLEGENGYAPTTWLAANDSQVLPIIGYSAVGAQNGLIGWIASGMRNELQTLFTAQAFPAEILPYVRRIIKYSATMVDGVYHSDYPTVDWFFTPSVYEMCGKCSDYATYRFCGEYEGYPWKETYGATYESLFGKDDTVNNLQARRATAVVYDVRDVFQEFGPLVVGCELNGSFGNPESKVAKFGFCL